MSDRELILAALRASAPLHNADADVDKQPQDAAEPSPTAEGQAPRAEPLPEAAERASHTDAPDLWARFEENLKALGGEVKTLADLQSLAGKKLWIDGDVKVELKSNTDSIWEAEVGITAADLAIAETGTLLLSAGLNKARLASLAPPIHVVLISQAKIVATLEEAMPHLTERSSVFITGPSRTADIEGILIRGVHGPGELWVIPIA